MSFYKKINSLYESAYKQNRKPEIVFKISSNTETLNLIGKPQLYKLQLHLGELGYSSYFTFEHENML